MVNYADENNQYCTGLKLSDVLIKLENAAKTLLQWFKDNRMKVNPEKYHLLINNTKQSLQRLVTKQLGTANMKSCWALK